MDENQYKQLCGICDKLLLEGSPTSERIPLAWLHVIREHPVFLSRYERLFARSFKSALDWLGWRRLVIEVLRILRQQVRALRHDLRGRALALNSADILIVSHLVNTQDTGDFYFGKLPEELARIGKSVVVALIDHSAVTSPHMRLLSDGSVGNLTRLVLPNTLSLRGELAMLSSMLSISMKTVRISEQEELNANVRYAAAGEAIAAASFQALRTAKQIENLVERLSPKALIVTFEGHAWERTAFQLARKKRSEIKCVGYQHAALFKLQHAIRRKLGNGADPDIIWTSGNVAAEELERGKSLSGVKISTVGSARASVNHLSTCECSKFSGGQFTCLVLPEGLKTECNILFEFSLACAVVYTKSTFIWRLHPAISFEALAKENSNLRRLPRNIILSKASIQDDIAKSHLALYRGSTAIIQAALAGVVPVYVRRSNEIPIDTLHGVDHGVGRVSVPADLLGVVDSVCAGDNSAFIQSYCKNLFEPMKSVAEILELLEKP